MEELTSIYDLQPHPEGGFYKRSYCSTGVILDSNQNDKFKGQRYFSTAIYYLLPHGARSKLHRIASDEMWHFYMGGPMTIIEISPLGTVKHTILGSNIKQGHKLQHVVPAGTWFGSLPNEGTAYSFVGCTVSPGFDFADFEMGDKQVLLAQFPHCKEIMESLL